MIRYLLTLALASAVTAGGLAAGWAVPAHAEVAHSAQWYAQHTLRCGDRDRDDKACIKARKRELKAWHRQQKQLRKAQHSHHKNHDRE